MNLLKRYGFGLPQSAGNILFNDDYEITLIFKDELPKGQFIEILDFPYPEKLINSKGYYYGELTLTLVNNCLLDRTQGREYCQSDIEVSLGTYDETTKRDISKPTIKNCIFYKKQGNILNRTLYLCTSSEKTKGFFKREPLLI